jgi:hypothetical protein
VSILYSIQPSLTLAELIPAWAKELAGGRTSVSQPELWRCFYEDTINGHLDVVGPRRSLGLAFIDRNGRAKYVRGRLLIGQMNIPFVRMADRILVMKEAVLDFARRRRLPPPSWWAKKTGASKKRKNAGPSGAQQQSGDASPRGRKPKADWDGGIKDFIFQQLDYHGWPQTGDSEWNCQAQVEAAVRKFIEDKYNISLSESVIRHHTHRLMSEWRQRRPEK